MKLGFEVEQAQLETANTHIVQAQVRIDLLRQRIEALRASGYRCDRSQALLALMLDALDLMKRHRRQLLHELAERQKAASSLAET